MGSVSPKTADIPLHGPLADEEGELTSIMSAEQRKALQQALKTEKESATLERDTARPPPSEARPVTIPRAAALPADLRLSADPRLEEAAAGEPATNPVPQQRNAAPAQPVSWATWEMLAFLLLAAAVAAALRT